ncbi:GNAT family N-acetyltransferase [Fundicoccus culcitae]|uniref:GNAT family N-acetyltransferase n=1 Tax=Fundicoccus culcitae TaxID=2969821 RepID=A0ABY5P4A0_9LACT|nr:GNAT family N-acetyltransferase [Fundicoccus culcitae]UUX33557.1 GNAT family N-acetyltransferase [Fundicoccus culcitae]
MIRPMQKSDMTQIKTIWLQTNLSAHDFVPSDYWYEQLEFLEAAMFESDVYVYEDKKLLGFIGLSSDFVEGLFVKEGFQSQGIGKRLIDHVKESHESLALTVYQRNWRAWRFYMRQGFVIKTNGFDEFNGEPDYFMTWP